MLSFHMYPVAVQVCDIYFLPCSMLFLLLSLPWPGLSFHCLLLSSLVSTVVLLETPGSPLAPGRFAPLSSPKSAVLSEHISVVVVVIHGAGKLTLRGGHSEVV